MAHQVSITLADDEYELFLAAARKNEEELEAYLSRLVEQHCQLTILLHRPFNDRAIQQYLERKDLVYRVPTDQPKAEVEHTKNDKTLE